MSKSKKGKDYKKQYPAVSEEVLDALKQSDQKMRYTEYDLKHGRYDKTTDTYHQSREVSLQMIEDKGSLLPDSTESLEDIVVRSIMIEQMMKAVDRLSQDEKQLIFYYFVSEKSQEECAKKLGVSRRTIGYRLKKIYEKLKKYIEI